MKTRRELDEEGSFLCAKFAELIKNQHPFPSHAVKELLDHYNKWDKEVELWHMEDRRKRESLRLRKAQRNYTNI